MRLDEKILLIFSRKVHCKDYIIQNNEHSTNALFLLSKVFPDFIHEITNKKVVDFGCGLGSQAIAMAKEGADYVLGIDTNQSAIEHCRELASDLSLDSKVEFWEGITDGNKGKFDIVVSRNSMEHFTEPESIITDMKSLLSNKGGEVIFITFGPLWFSPYGSHMNFFTKIPWVNILFSEKAVMNVRSRFRSDGATKYKDVENGLNLMTVSKFERIVKKSKMEIQYCKYECVKGLNFLAKIPMVRELFINRINCVLSFLCNKKMVVLRNAE